MAEVAESSGAEGGLAKNADLVAVPFTKPKPSRKIGIAWRQGSGRGEEAAAIARVIAGLFENPILNS